jgi:flagellar basal body rod protein FlgB
VLDKGLAQTTQPAATHPAHFKAEKAAGVSLKETEGLEPKRDGNNVQLDRELLHMAEASGEFARAQAALSAKFRLVRYAINDGRR